VSQHLNRVDGFLNGLASRPNHDFTVTGVEEGDTSGYIVHDRFLADSNEVLLDVWLAQCS